MARRLKRGLPLRLVLVAGVVGLLHLVAIDRLAVLMDAARPEPMPARLSVVYVRTLQPEAPAVALPRPAPPARVTRRLPAAPERLAAIDDAPLERTARAEVPEKPPLPEPAASAPGIDAPVPVADAAPPFDWPESTRLRYRVSGQVRGEVHGSAEVEWIRAGSRYQVHLDVVVGLPVAPLFTRRMSSDGVLGDDGLRPRRYDERTQIAFRDARRATLRLDDDAVWLPRGARVPRPAALQDSASQFVQIAWLLAVRPELGRSGARIELPLALPRHVVPWAYDVIGEESVSTGIGAVAALKLAPAQAARAGDFGVEAWFAPSLRHLPVRIVIRQDDATFLDLTLARLPEIGAETAASAAASAAVPR